jgi:hypothetical protein
LIKKELNGLRDPDTNEKYPRWRDLSLVTILMTLGFEAETSQVDELIKRKRINNEEKLTEQLEGLQMEVGTSKALGISLEEQILIKEKLRKFTKQ